MKPNYVLISDKDKKFTSFLELNKFLKLKNMLGENLLYEPVFISPENIVYRSDVLKRWQLE